MFTVKLVKVAIVRRVVFRTVPPAPVAALRDQNLLEGQVALRLVRTCRVLRIELASVVEIIPGTIILWSANPNVEVGVDPGPRHNRLQLPKNLVPGNCFGN